MNEEMIQQDEQAENIDRFYRQNTEVFKLERADARHLERYGKGGIYVHTPHKSSRHREQQIDISYDLVGTLPVSLLNNLQNGETA